MKNKVYKIFHRSFLEVIIGLLIILGSLLYLILLNRFDTVEAYILYLIMSYCFIIFSVKLYDTGKLVWNNIINKNRYLKEYYNNPKLRYKVSLYSSLFLNIIYTLFKLVTGIFYRSLWLISFAIYYFILVMLRLNIAKGELKRDGSINDEYERYRNVGIILLFINVFLVVVILVIVNQHIVRPYNQIVAITVACYTFFLMIKSVISLIKYRKYNSPLMSSAKIINVVTSMISMLSLEIIMLSTFGPEETEFNEIMVMATGGGISAIIIAISLGMIIKATEWLNKGE